MYKKDGSPLALTEYEQLLYDLMLRGDVPLTPEAAFLATKLWPSLPVNALTCTIREAARIVGLSRQNISHRVLRGDFRVAVQHEEEGHRLPAYLDMASVILFARHHETTESPGGRRAWRPTVETGRALEDYLPDDILEVMRSR